MTNHHSNESYGVTYQRGGGSPQPQKTREPVLNIPAVIIGLIGLCSLIYVAQNYLISEEHNFIFMLNFAFIPARFTYGSGFYDPAALFTMLSYSFMHGSFAHLAVNMVWLAAFGSPLAGRIGTSKILIFWALTSIVAVLTHYAIYPTSNIPLVGASGAISGIMGAAARYGFRRVPTHSGNKNMSAFAGPLLPVLTTLTYRPVITFVGIWFIINIITGVYSAQETGLASIAWEAHIGGFLAGFFGIALLDRPKEYDRYFKR